MIGIYGGTFDPVHYGHLRSALEVRELFGLDEIKLIPSSNPPHRKSPNTSAESRLEMLELSVQHQQGMNADRRELDRDGYSFMIDTVKSIRDEHIQGSLLLFIGTDAFNGLDTWHQWQRLFDYVHIVVMTRPGYQSPVLADFLLSKLTKNKKQLLALNSGYLFFQAVTQLDISASFIREKIKQGASVDFLLPESVIKYIKTNTLY